MKHGAQATGNRALGAEIDVGHDILEGKNVKQAIKSRGIEAVKYIVHRGVKQSGNQSGGGRKRKAPIKAIVQLQNPTVGRSPRSRKQIKVVAFLF